MNTRARYEFLKRFYPDDVIVLSGDELDKGKVRTYNDSAEKLRWTNGASYYTNAKGEPGLFIDITQLKKRYRICLIDTNAWLVLM